MHGLSLPIPASPVLFTLLTYSIDHWDFEGLNAQVKDTSVHDMINCQKIPLYFVWQLVWCCECEQVSPGLELLLCLSLNDPQGA